MTDELRAVHIGTSSHVKRNEMRGSKYIPSAVSKETYSNVASDLCAGKIVLFSGTPCQIAAIKNYLVAKRIDATGLLSVEVICHGVGSPKFFRDYISHLEKRYASKACACKFRAKRQKGQKQDMEVVFANGKKYNAASTSLDWFYSAYHKNLILRESCYVCKYATEVRTADISIADLWGSEEKEDFSLVVINTTQGKEVIEKCTRKAELSALESKYIHQPHMHTPGERPENRDVFWETYLSKGYLKAQALLGNNTVLGRAKYLFARIARALHTTETLKAIRAAVKKL